MKRESAAAAEAAAHAAADAADAAEEAELEAGHAAKVAANPDVNLTPSEKRAANATASAAKETVRAAQVTANAAHSTAEAAAAAAEAFADTTGTPYPTAKLPNLSPTTNPSTYKQVPRLHVQTNFPNPNNRSPHRSPLTPSPLRQPMQLTKPTDSPEEDSPPPFDQASSLSDLMKSLDLDPSAKIASPEIETEAEPESSTKQSEKRPLIPISPASEQTLDDKARNLSKIAKEVTDSAASWELIRKRSQTEEASTPESPFSTQMRSTIEDIQQILRQTDKERARDLRHRKPETVFEQPEMKNASSPALMRVESMPNQNIQQTSKEASSPQFDITRHGRSKSMTGLTAPFSPTFRMLGQDPHLSPPAFGSRAQRYDRRVSGGSLTSERTPMFSPDFHKILAKSQEFWTNTGSLSGELRRGMTGYLDPIGDNRRAWAQIREGMRTSAASLEGDAVCVLAGSQGAREVIKSSLLFRGLTNTEVMDGEAYMKLLRRSRPPHFRVVIAEADLFVRIGMTEKDLRESEAADGLAEVLNPAIFDPRISTRYILLISCKYHRFGKYIEFAVPPVQGGSGEDTVKVVFCANNPVRRSSLAQSLLACVTSGNEERREGKATEGVTQSPEVPSPPQTSRTSLRILLCEDNLVNIEVLTRQLKKLGYTNCDIKHNGAEGVKAFMEKEYDIVLMDCQMPILDGYEATIEIRKLEKENQAKKRVPIVALTASAMPEEREKGLKSGMDNYLSKPVQLAVLQNILESVQTQ